MKPSMILQKLCKDAKIEPPRYTSSTDTVSVHGRTFHAPGQIENESGKGICRYHTIVSL